jgi:hypothetical protein
MEQPFFRGESSIVSLRFRDGRTVDLRPHLRPRLATSAGLVDTSYYSARAIEKIFPREITWRETVLPEMYAGDNMPVGEPDFEIAVTKNLGRTPRRPGQRERGGQARSRCCTPGASRFSAFDPTESQGAIRANKRTTRYGDDQFPSSYPTLSDPISGRSGGILAGRVVLAI